MGGNLKLENGVEAQSLLITTESRSVLASAVWSLLYDINNDFLMNSPTPLWSDDVFQSGEFLSGSTKHFLNTNDVSCQEFATVKPIVGDIDVQIDSKYARQLEEYLSKAVECGKLFGFQFGNEQISSLWPLTVSNSTPMVVQIDFEFVKYTGDFPMEWSVFSHSSSWDDLRVGIKGVFHKFLIKSLTALSNRSFILRKYTGRGRQKTSVDVEMRDNMLSFAVSSKEGGGLRNKYRHITDTDGAPQYISGLPLMEKLPPANYTQTISGIFDQLFKDCGDIDMDLTWSFVGLVELMKRHLSVDQQITIRDDFVYRLFGKGAQGLYRDDPYRDSDEKMTAISYINNALGLNGTELHAMIVEYQRAYKVSNPNKVTFKRKAIKHIHKPGSSAQLSAIEAIELCKEIDSLGGNLNYISMREKIDGANIKFGRDWDSRPFLMTSSIARPLYATDVGMFAHHATETGGNINRAEKYDALLQLMTDPSFAINLPKNTVVEAEVLYMPFGTNTDMGVRFVNIPYDIDMLGKVATLIPLSVKRLDSGQPRADSDTILENIHGLGNEIKVINNRLPPIDVDVSDIIQPVINLTPEMVTAVRSRSKALIEQKRHVLGIIDATMKSLADAISATPKPQLLGKYTEGVVLEFPSGRIVKVTSPEMKACIDNVTHPRSIAVVAIGNFIGHIGHEQLINHAIAKARDLGGTPYVFVGGKVGEDDPIDTDTKVDTLKKLFPSIMVDSVKPQYDHKTNKQVPGDIFKKIEYELIKAGPRHDTVYLVVGEDRRSDVERMADVMTTRFSKYEPLNHVTVHAVVTPREARVGDVNISSTFLRSVLKDVTLTPDQQRAYWFSAFNVNTLGTQYVSKLMDIARGNMNLEYQESALRRFMIKQLTNANVTEAHTYDDATLIREYHANIPNAEYKALRFNDAIANLSKPVAECSCQCDACQQGLPCPGKKKKTAKVHADGQDKK